MHTLNLLDGTAPAYSNHKLGISKRFLIVTGIGTTVVSLMIFFLEVIFVAFNIGDGSLVASSHTSKIMVSQDEFSKLNRDHATASSIFADLIQRTPSDASFKMMKLTQANRMVAQGYISSKVSGESMFASMNSSDYWEIISSEVYDKTSEKDKNYKFQFTAIYTAPINQEYSFKSGAQFPPSTEIDRVIEEFTTIGVQAGLKNVKAPVIEKTIEGTTLFEYQYSMATVSSYKVFHTFLTNVYRSGLPIIFESITLRSHNRGVTTQIIFRVLTN